MLHLAARVPSSAVGGGKDVNFEVAVPLKGVAKTNRLKSEQEWEMDAAFPCLLTDKPSIVIFKPREGAKPTVGYK